MKHNFISVITISVMAATLEFSSVPTVFAEDNPAIVVIDENDYDIFKTINPRFTYVQSADIGVYPSKTETKYSMNIRGISEVTGVKGKMTLYKKKSNDDFEEKESAEIDMEGSEIQCNGSFKSYGAGEYKLEFSGTVCAKSGSEPVTFRNFNSY